MPLLECRRLAKDFPIPGGRHRVFGDVSFALEAGRVAYAASNSAKLQVVRKHPERFCLDGKVLRLASAMKDQPREKLSAAGHRKLATLAAKENMSPDALLDRLITVWRSWKA